MKAVAQQQKAPATEASAPAVAPASTGRGNAWAQERLAADQQAGQQDHGHDHAHGHGEASQEAPGRGAGRGAARGPSEATLDADRPVGAAIPADVRTRLMDELARAPESSGVLETIRAKRGNVDFPIVWSRRGGFQSGDKISVDRRQGEADWLATLAHEIVHLKAFLYDEQGKVETQTREDYITTQMDEEIEAHASSFVTLLSLGVGSNGAAGYDEFVDWLAVEHPDLAVSELDPDAELANQAAIKEVAKPWLEDKYRNVWRGSATQLNYYDKWGAHWDAEHAAAP